MLLKSTLLSIPAYYLLLFLAPTSVIEKLEQLKEFSSEMWQMVQGSFT